MTNTNTVQIGVMPGRINGFVIEEGTTFAQALNLAELDASGYEVKADGVKITDLNTPVSGSVNTILLTKQVKGNANTVQIGVMPGRINGFVLEEGSTYAQALALAELDASGYEVKADGTKITDLNQVVSSSTNTILLTKQVKGNSKTVQVGVMPGRINGFVVEDGTTYAQLLALAELDASGYEVKADGSKVTDLNTTVGSSVNTVLLTKQVKGNAIHISDLNDALIKALEKALEKTLTK